MRFDHYFWDYDGTLFDSYPRIIRGFARGAGALGIALKAEALLPLAKVSVRHMIRVTAERFGIPPEALQREYHRYAEADNYEAARPYEGAVSLLEAVVRHGGRNYLYTHSGASTIRSLEYYGIKEYFADYITAEDSFPSKPAPDALLYMIRKHRLDTARCVMLGDRDIDVQAGLNAGMAGALFDPDGFYGDMPIEYRFKTMREMERTLVGE